MPKIYSMLSNDKAFPTYKERKEGDGMVKRNAYDTAILIKGGANLQDRTSLNESKAAFKVTDVTAEQLKQLQANPSFKRQVETGFITVDKEPVQTKRDKSAPKTKADVKANPKTAKAQTKLNDDSEE